MIKFSGNSITSVADLEMLSRTHKSVAFADSWLTCLTETWEEFKGGFVNINDDKHNENNLLYRWDVSLNDEKYELQLMTIHQESGTIYCTIIRDFRDEDVKDFLNFLQYRKRYIDNLWSII